MVVGEMVVGRGKRGDTGNGSTFWMIMCESTPLTNAPYQEEQGGIISRLPPPLVVVSPLSSTFRHSLTYLDILPLPPPLRQCILPPKLTRRLAVHHPVPPVVQHGTNE
jgi:hypothetical protein